MSCMFLQIAYTYIRFVFGMEDTRCIIIIYFSGSGKSILTGFSLLRLGPKSGQRSKETYKLDEEGNGITLNAEIVTVDGYHPRLIRYLERVEGASTEKGATASAIIKRICDASFGWDLFEFWY